MKKIKISICINTYKRPELLFKLLTSLNEQELHNTIELEIIVVDNSPEKEGIDQVINFLPVSKHHINYAEQPIKNISITRNKAVSLATGEYICFIDDDEYADKLWVQTLFNCLIRFEADGVFGRVVPYFAPNTPKYIIDGRYFNQIDQITGEISRNAYTNNCLLKANLIKQFEEPFLISLGKTGGEDVNLFSRLKNQKAKLIHCDEAIVYDFIPLQRANMKWLTKRFYRNGITSTENKVNNAKNQTFIKIYYLIRYLIFFMLSIALTFVFIFKKTTRNFWYLKTIGNIGHIASIFGIKYEEYK